MTVPKSLKWQEAIDVNGLDSSRRREDGGTLHCLRVCSVSLSRQTYSG